MSVEAIAKGTCGRERSALSGACLVSYVARERIEREPGKWRNLETFSNQEANGVEFEESQDRVGSGG